MPEKSFILDPGATLDYKFDFAGLRNGSEGAETNWLDVTSSPIEQITTRAITVSPQPSPLELVVDSNTLEDGNTSVQVFLKSPSPGKRYTVTCAIVTTSTPVARKDERSIEIIGRQR